MVSDTTFILAITYALIYLMAYRKDKTAGSLMFVGVGAVTLLIEGVEPALSFVLVAIPLAMMVVNWLMSPMKKKVR